MGGPQEGKCSKNSISDEGLSDLDILCSGDVFDEIEKNVENSGDKDSCSFVFHNERNDQRHWE